MNIRASRQYDEPLDRFVGKDAWIKVGIPSLAYADGYAQYYVRIQSVTTSAYYDKCYRVNRLDVWDVEADCNYDAYNDEDLEAVFNKIYVVPTTRFVLFTPIEILSTEEVLERIRGSRQV